MLNMDGICTDIHKLLFKKDVIQLSSTLDVTPADEETKKFLKEFLETCVARNKHRDTNISASFI